MRNISVLVKPASGMCNMTCDYCFYCDEAAKREQEFYGMMSEDTLKNLIRRTMLQAEGVASYTWQGGEPSLRVGKACDILTDIVSFKTCFICGCFCLSSVRTCMREVRYNFFYPYICCFH